MVRSTPLLIEPMVTLALIAVLVFQFEWDLGKQGRSDVVDESGDRRVCRVR